MTQNNNEDIYYIITILVKLLSYSAIDYYGAGRGRTGAARDVIPSAC